MTNEDHDRIMGTYTATSAIFGFLQLRQTECTNPLDVVPVKKIGGGIPNECMGNAIRMADSDATRYRVVSGWLFHRFDKMRGHQLIEQHWWAYDALEDRHVDPTPEIPVDAIYIEDLDLIDFVVRNQQRVPEGVPLNNVVFKSGRIFLARVVNGQTVSRQARSLATDALFDGVLTVAAR